MRCVILSALLLVAACGHRTKLIRPSDIPEYEQKRQEKMEKYAPYDPDNTAPRKSE